MKNIFKRFFVFSGNGLLIMRFTLFGGVEKIIKVRYT